MAITSTRLTTVIAFVIRAHATCATKPSKAVRQWDGQTPYSIHPIWCATTILAETTLPEELRASGAEALLLHDVLEDTTANLPAYTTPRVRTLVHGMTFASFDEEMQLVWERGIEILLLKLYDKTSNLLDGAWMSAEKRASYNAYTLRLADDVEKAYGPLTIVRLARAIAS